MVFETLLKVGRVLKSFLIMFQSRYNCRCEIIEHLL